MSLSLAVSGYLMLFIIVFLLMKEKTIPVVLFTLIPIIMAYLAGFSTVEIVVFIKAGVKKVSDMSILFIFSITYFGTMSDVGMFDGLVNGLVKIAGKNIVFVAVATAIIATVTHLDGATATTVAVTIPAMLPIYKRLNIRTYLLLLITACAMGVMNLLPWGGPVVRAAAVLQNFGMTEMDGDALWHILIPMQIFGLVATIVLAVVMAMRESKFHGAGEVNENIDLVEASTIKNEEKDKLKKPKLLYFNLLLTAFLLVIMMVKALAFNKFPSYYVFMFGCAVALLVNFPNFKEQKARIRAHAPNAIDIASVIIAAGIMLGVLTESKMLDAMAIPLLDIIPNAVGRFLHIIMGILAMPLGLILGTDSYFYGLMPLVMEVGKVHNVEPLNMAITMLVGKNISLLISPLVPATFMAIGLADVKLRDHIKYSFIPLWIVSISMIIFALIIGMIVI